MISPALVLTTEYRLHSNLIWFESTYFGNVGNLVTWVTHMGNDHFTTDIFKFLIDNFLLRVLENLPFYDSSKHT